MPWNLEADQSPPLRNSTSGGDSEEQQKTTSIEDKFNEAIIGGGAKDDMGTDG